MLLLLLRLLFAYIVISALIRLIRGIAEGMRLPPEKKPPTAVALARDPVCGTFVVPARALSSGTGAEMRFFCSEKCLRAYAAQTMRRRS